MILGQANRIFDALGDACVPDLAAGDSGRPAFWISQL